MLFVDEQICATEARHHIKQYIPKKPHKYGFKLFVLAGVSGFACNFEFYTGAKKNTISLPSGLDDLGVSGSTVDRLTLPVVEHINHKIYFDTYYTSVNLMTFLKSKGILCLGTVRRDRILFCKIPSDNEFKKNTGEVP